MAEDFASKLGLVAPSSGGGDFASKLGLVKVESKPEQPGVFGKIWGDIKGAGQQLATDVMAEPDKPSSVFDIGAATAKGGRILKDVANLAASPVTSGIHHLVSEPVSAAGQRLTKAFPSPDDIDLALSAGRTIPKAPPQIPAGYNVLRGTGPAGMDKFGLPAGEKPPIPSNYDPVRNVERPVSPQTMPHADQAIPDVFDVMGDTMPKTKAGVAPPAMEARKAGYVLPPHMITDQPGMTAKLLSGEGGKLKLQQSASVKNQEITNGLARKGIGLSEKTALSRQSLEAVREKAGQSYKAIKEVVPETSMSPGGANDRWFFGQIQELGGRLSAAAKELPDLFKNPEIDNLVKALGSKSSISTEGALQTVRQLRHDASINFRARDNPQKAGLAFAQRQAADLLDELIERNIVAAEANQRLDKRIGRYLNEPDPRLKTLAQDYRNARQLIAKTHDIEDALNPATGDVKASRLAALANRGHMLSDELATIANTHSAFPKALQNVAQIGGADDYSALDMFGAALSVMHGHPGVALAIAGRPFSRAGLLSERFQNRLVAPPRQRIPFTAPDASEIANQASQVPGQQ